MGITGTLEGRARAAALAGESACSIRVRYQSCSSGDTARRHLTGRRSAATGCRDIRWSRPKHAWRRDKVLLGVCYTPDYMARSSARYQQFALLGARQRYDELQAEVTTILKAFPELRTGGNARPADTARNARAAKTRARKRPTMTAVQKKAVSARMKKYWASRRRESKDTE